MSPRKWCYALLVHPYRRPRRVRGLVEVPEGPRDLGLPIVRDLRLLMPVLREGIVDVGLDALRVESVREFCVELIPQGGPFQVAGLQLGLLADPREAEGEHVGPFG